MATPSNGKLNNPLAAIRATAQATTSAYGKGFFEQSRTAGNAFETAAEQSTARATSTQAQPHQLRVRARKALWFGFRMIASFITWELILSKIIGQAKVDANRTVRFIRIAREFRKLALDLGGVWIKLGQFLSTRVDIIPPQVVVELQGLQDAVPAEPPHVIIPIIETNLGRPITDIFDEFDPEPIAAASFGQAHLALLKPISAAQSADSAEPLIAPRSRLTAQRVIVKVQRPNLDAIVNTDIGALKTIIKWLKLYEPIRRRADLTALTNEFAEGVFEELDYEQEARNIEQFTRDFAADPAVRVPQVYLASKRVLVLENVEEIKITDFQGLEDAGISRSQVAHKLFETYLQQIFVDGFFHADPHPGNLFVQPLDWDFARKLGIRESANATSIVKTPPVNNSLGLPQIRIPILSDVLDELNRPSREAQPTQPPIASSPPPSKSRPFRLVFIDFGMVGRVTPANMQELKEIIISTSLKDARRMTAALQRMGFFIPEADTLRIEQAIGGLFDHMWGRTLTDLQNVDFDQMYDFALQFRDLLSSLPFQVPQNVLYLGRATNILSGMCTALDPTFNPWTALQPFAQGMAAAPGALSSTAPGATLFNGGTVQDVVKEALKLGRLGIQLPGQTEAVISRALNGQLEVRAHLSPASTHELRRIEASVSRLTWALVLIALVVCGTVLLINAIPVAGVVAFVLAVPVLVRLLTL